MKSKDKNKPASSTADTAKEPVQGTPDQKKNPDYKPSDKEIVRAAIHPSIGIARMGNSPEGYYIGPEVTDPAPVENGQHRDENGAILRQAARFRIYGYNAAGEVVGELDASQADIKWTVHVANSKAAWYRFDKALDIPAAKGLSTARRNPTIVGEARKTLVIDPGPRSISGTNTQGTEYAFDSGSFRGTKVYLGELKTDDAGRLLFLGGRGVSKSPSKAPIYIPDDALSFNNADGWYDDTSDGSVHAELSIKGRSIPVDSAWVVTAPPNFAPDVIGWRTMYDCITNIYIEAGRADFPETVSFTKDVYPILQRMTGLQWVNKGFDAMFGYDGPMNMEDPILIEKLSSKHEAYQELRRTILNSFRGETVIGPNRGPWPWIYGDAYGDDKFANSPRVNLMLPDVQYQILRLWVDGKFENDWETCAEQSKKKQIEDVDLADQPAMLDRASLHYCLADAFHPGCELTWPMRHNSMYRAPYRIREKTDGTAPIDYGKNLTPEIALRVGGPLYEQSPGDLTRWMALPWQADTGFCRSGYDHEYDPYVPTFWPARVPNQVLTTADYLIVMDTKRSKEERVAAFHRRKNWERELPRDTVEAMNYMVEHFGAQGIVEARPGIPNDPDFPPMMWVENRPGDDALKLEDIDTSDIDITAHQDSLAAAGWESEAHCEAFRQVKRWNT